MAKKFMTTEEVAEYLCVPVNTIRHWRWKSTGPQAIKLGRRVLYPVDECDAWIDAHRAQVSA